ncbi:MAG: hypothetical protein LBJ41_07315 [Treponema sp.]|jgi:hypothetical protein|nr:hypothetical protein [Treponema sp.]
MAEFSILDKVRSRDIGESWSVPVSVKAIPVDTIVREGRTLTCALLCRKAKVLKSGDELSFSRIRAKSKGFSAGENIVC